MSKKIRIFGIFMILLILSACGNNGNHQSSLKEIPSDYSLKDAKRDGCVVHEDGDIADGEEVWEAFLAKVESNEPATIRLANYYTLDPDTCSEEYYEAEKDKYPMLFISELSYDGNKYTYRYYENGQEYEKTFKYLMRYEEEPESPTATFVSVIRYVLTDDNTVTWNDLFMSLASSQLDAYIPQQWVYTDYIYKQ